MFHQMIRCLSRHKNVSNNLILKNQITTSSASYCCKPSESRPSTAQSESMLDIGTRHIFNSDHDILRASARKFFNEEIKPHHDEWEANGLMPKEFFEVVGKAGLICIETPEKYGGPGGSFLDHMVAVEECCYAGCSAPGFYNHSFVVAPYILNHATEDAKQKYLPGMATGEIVASIGMTEPGGGSDLQAIKTTAKRDGDDWIINGSKTFITNGIISDLTVVAAVTQPDAKSRAHGMSLFIVESKFPGFKKGRSLKKLGLKGQDTAELFFEDVRVPASNLIGQPNKGFYMMMDLLPQERVGVGIGYAAICEYIFELTRSYVKERKAFGKPIIDLQVIRHKMAEMKINICAARAFTDECIKLHDQKQLGGAMASMCKTLTTDLVNKVAYDCVQLHGGYGFMEEYPVARAYRDVRIGPIYAGTNEIMKELIGRTIAS